jgi:predicted Zn-ribbon and HTH transcriptional regulator
MRKRKYRKKAVSQTGSVKFVLSAIAVLLLCGAVCSAKIYYKEAADNLLNKANNVAKTIKRRGYEKQNLVNESKRCKSSEYIDRMNIKFNLGLRYPSPGQVVRIDGAAYAGRQSKSNDQLVYAYVD